MITSVLVTHSYCITHIYNYSQNRLEAYRYKLPIFLSFSDWIKASTNQEQKLVFKPRWYINSIFYFFENTKRRELNWNDQQNIKQAHKLPPSRIIITLQSQCRNKLFCNEHQWKCTMNFHLEVRLKTNNHNQKHIDGYH